MLSHWQQCLPGSRPRFSFCHSQSIKIQTHNIVVSFHGECFKYCVTEDCDDLSVMTRRKGEEEQEETVILINMQCFYYK